MVAGDVIVILERVGDEVELPTETVTNVEVENIPAVPMTVVVPTDTAVNNPLEFIVPTEELEVVQSVVVAKVFPY